MDLSQPEAEALARQWLDKALAEDTEGRAVGSYQRSGRGSALEVVEAADDLAQAELAEAREALAEADLGKVEGNVERFLRDQGIVLPRGSEAGKAAEAWRRIAHAFLRANVQYWERVSERLAGQWREDEPNGAAVSPAVSPVVTLTARREGGPPVQPQVQGERLSEIYTKYKQERRPSAKTEADWNAAMRRFTEVNGDLPVRAITRTHVREYKDHLPDPSGPWPRAGRRGNGQEGPRRAQRRAGLGGRERLLRCQPRGRHQGARPGGAPGEAAALRCRGPEGDLQQSGVHPWRATRGGRWRGCFLAPAPGSVHPGRGLRSWASCS